MLREAMFINGILYNSEAWHGLKESHVEKLSKIDNQLMRSLLSAHAQIPNEFLYLETGILSVSFVILSRRLNYLKEIHSREDHELLKRVYTKQKINPVKGDWTHLQGKILGDPTLISHGGPIPTSLNLRSALHIKYHTGEKIP